MGFVATCTDRLKWARIFRVIIIMIYRLMAYGNWVGVPWINWKRKLRKDQCHQLERFLFSLCGWKKDLWCVVVLHFLGTNGFTVLLLLDLVALERMYLVGITIELTLTSPDKDLEKKKHIQILMAVRHGKRVQFNQSVCCMLVFYSLFFLHFVGKYY